MAKLFYLFGLFALICFVLHPGISAAANGTSMEYSASDFKEDCKEVTSYCLNSRTISFNARGIPYSFQFRDCLTENSDRFFSNPPYYSITKFNVDCYDVATSCFNAGQPTFAERIAPSTPRARNCIQRNGDKFYNR